MIPDNLSKSQEFSSLTSREKKILNEKADKMCKSFLSKLPDFSFDNNTMTSFGNMVLKKFKNYI